MVERATAGDVDAAVTELSALRTLCAHRDGEYGVTSWNRRVEQRLGARARDRWYAGRPLLVTCNDAALDLMNGDLGVIVQSSAGPRAAFAAVTGTRQLPPVRLSAIETVHATTIHKSQGSEFGHVVVVLPPPGSQLLTRELLYTAVTRARVRVTIVGGEAALRAGIARAAGRASGLGELLAGTF
jgi:exodeoxyribonuclease V alpha subunit